MRFEAIPPRMRAIIRTSAAVLLVSVGGCVPPPLPATAAVQPQLPADPVLAYVASGPIGRTAVVNEPAMGGNVIVVIDTQYNAASGQICRTYAVTASGGQLQHLACGTGDDWQAVMPLVASNN